MQKVQGSVRLSWRLSEAINREGQQNIEQTHEGLRAEGPHPML